MIKVENAEVNLTETTVRSLIRAIERAKAEREFPEAMKSMPDGDMSVEQYEEEKKKRGYIVVSSPYSGIKFRVAVETRPRSQESLGYSLED